MKTTVDIPDELHRLIKAKSALEGRTVREVAITLFEEYVGASTAKKAATIDAAGPAPPWFGAVRHHLSPAASHDLDSIRESIGRALGSR